MAHALTADERLSPGRVAGVGFGLVGVATLIGPAAGGDLGVAAAAQVAVLPAPLTNGRVGGFGRRCRGMPPLLPETGQVTASALMVLPVALVVGLALLCTALAHVIYFQILSAAGATNLPRVTYLVPVSALLLGATLLGERLEPQAFAGMTLIFAGLMAVDGRPVAAGRRRGRRPAPRVAR